MGRMFYRGIDPSDKGYADLRYFSKWHDVMSEAEKRIAEGG